MSAPHHMTLGLGEPKVSHSSEAFWPSTKVYTLPSSLRIWAGSSENKNTQREVSQPHRNRRYQRAAPGEQKTTRTNDIDVGVGEDGAMSVGGLALVDGRVAEVDVL